MMYAGRYRRAVYDVCRTVEVGSVRCMQDGGGGPCMMYAGSWGAQCMMYAGWWR